MSEPHEAIFGCLAPVDTRLFFRINDIFFTGRTPALRLIGEKFDFYAAGRTLEITDFDIFLPAGTRCKHKKQ
jgi:hypothetical protein